MLSESESKLYTNFELCEEKNLGRWEYVLIYKAKKFMMTKIIPRKV